MVKARNLSTILFAVVLFMTVPFAAVSQGAIKNIASSKDHLIVALPSDPSNFDPNDNSIQMVHAMKKQIYETLVWRDHDGTLKPQFAES